MALLHYIYPINISLYPPFLWICLGSQRYELPLFYTITLLFGKQPRYYSSRVNSFIGLLNILFNFFSCLSFDPVLALFLAPHQTNASLYKIDTSRSNVIIKHSILTVHLTFLWRSSQSIYFVSRGTIYKCIVCPLDTLHASIG